jgi:hypothetical protein
MKHRKLRIAWSVAWGIAAVLLCVLWAHTVENQVTGAGWISNSRQVRFVLFHHWMQFDGAYYNANAPPASRPQRYYYDHHVDQPDPLTAPIHRWLVQHYNPPKADGANLTIAGPFWCPVLAMAVIASISWLPWSSRFSLRTLLIATTLVAVVLGLAVWAIR